MTNTTNIATENLATTEGQCQLEAMFEFAQQQRETTGDLHTHFCDLENLLRECWERLTPTQRDEVLNSDPAQCIWGV